MALGIVGIIMGLVWEAASAMYEGHRANQATTEVLYILGQVQGYGGWPSLIGASTGNLISLGMFPSDTISNNSAACGVYNVAAPCALNPWNGLLNIGTATGSGTVGNPNNGTGTFSYTSGLGFIYFEGLSVANCIKLAAAVTAGVQSNAYNIVFIGAASQPGNLTQPNSTVNMGTLPISVSKISSICQTLPNLGVNAALGFAFAP